MRIIAGKWRGRRIDAPAGERVRPTADRVREAWMSIVQRWIPDARVLDLFAGSGALGLEALSRGAAHVELVELAPESIRALQANIAALDASAWCTVRRGDAMGIAEQLPAGAFDLAFADPPYGRGLAERLASHWLDVPFATRIGIEHGVREPMPDGGDTRRYGTTAITIYRRE